MWFAGGGLVWGTHHCEERQQRSHCSAVLPPSTVLRALACNRRGEGGRRTRPYMHCLSHGTTTQTSVYISTRQYKVDTTFNKRCAITLQGKLKNFTESCQRRQINGETNLIVIGRLNIVMMSTPPKLMGNAILTKIPKGLLKNLILI